MRRSSKLKLFKDIVRSIYAGDQELVLTLISSQNINDEDKDGRTALFYAVFAESISLVNNFIRVGSDVNKQDHLGWSCLHYCAQQYQLEIASLLLNNGAEVDTEDTHSNTPLWTATFNSQGRGDMIALLLKNGADPFHKNNHGISPIELADTITNFSISQFF